MKPNFMPSQSDISSSSQTNDEIDLMQIFQALVRRNRLIAKITAASILLTGIYAFSKKYVWEGQFEIVLARSQSTSSQANSLLQSNPTLARLIGASGGNNQLETEVEILESPSV